MKKITVTEENGTTKTFDAGMFMLFMGERVGKEGLDVHVITDLIETEIDERTTFYFAILNSLKKRAKENKLFGLVCAAFQADIFEEKLPAIEKVDEGAYDERAKN